MEGEAEWFEHIRLTPELSLMLAASSTPAIHPEESWSARNPAAWPNDGPIQTTDGGIARLAGTRTSFWGASHTRDGLARAALGQRVVRQHHRRAPGLLEDGEAVLQEIELLVGR